MKKNDFTALKRTGANMASSVLALLLSMLVGGVLVSAIGVNPFVVYRELINGGIGSTTALVGTLNRMAPILFAGIALTVGNASGIFNIGFEGQYLCGSLAAVMVGYLVQLPPVLHVTLTLVAGMLGAMLWSLPPILLFLKKEINVVFSAIMLNYVMQFLSEFFIMKLPGYEPSNNGTPRINESAMLPNLIETPVKINASVLISVLAVVVVYIILFRMKAGYEMRVVGLNRHAARSAGIAVPKRMFGAMMLSAAFAGLAGSMELMGTTLRLQHNYSPGYMGMGIAVAMLGKQNPFAILVAAFLFSAMKNGSTLMQMKTGVSAQFVLALQGLIIIFICSENFIRYLMTKIRMKGKRRAEHA